MNDDRDRAMNLSQHAARTGYSREQLARFRPLLIGGKIRPSELDRHIYEYRKALMKQVTSAPVSTSASSPAESPQWQAILRKFHGQDTKSARSGAYSAPVESLKDSSA